MTVPDPLERPVLSVPEAGAICGLGRSASFDAVRRGELPVIRFGRRLAVPTAALLTMLGLSPDGPNVGAAELSKVANRGAG